MTVLQKNVNNLCLFIDRFQVLVRFRVNHLFVLSISHLIHDYRDPLSFQYSVLTSKVGINFYGTMFNWVDTFV